MKNKTLFTIAGVIVLFCVRLCTQTSEAKPPGAISPAAPCECVDCQPATDLPGCMAPPHRPASTL